MYNDLLYSYGNSPADKIEKLITFALSHARLYLAESDDELYDKSAAGKTFNISCGDGVSSSSLSAIAVSLSATYDLIRCWIFTSAWFIPNDPLPSDYMVGLYNDSMLGIGGVYTNIDEGSFVLHNLL